MEVAWGEMLGHPALPPKWFVERLPGEHPRPWQVPATLFMLLRPWVFWRAVRLAHRPRIGVLVTLAALAPLMIYLAAAAWPLLAVIRPLIAGTLPRGARLTTFAWPWGRSTNWWFWIGAIAPVLSPLVFWCLGNTLERARVFKASHVLRAGVYGCLGVALITMVNRLLRVAILLLSSGRARPVPRSDFLDFVLIDPPGFLQLCGFRATWGMAFSLAWLGCFWWYAIRRYLRLPHATAVWCSVMLISLLGAMAVVQEWPNSGFEWYRQDLFTVFFW